MDRKELVDYISKRANISRKEANDALNAVIDALKPQDDTHNVQQEFDYEPALAGLNFPLRRNTTNKKHSRSSVLKYKSKRKKSHSVFGDDDDKTDDPGPRVGRRDGSKRKYKKK